MKDDRRTVSRFRFKFQNQPAFLILLGNSSDFHPISQLGIIFNKIENVG